MGTTLTGTTPQDTYDSLIKVTDNGPISGTAKFLSDGLGNDSALALSTTAVGIGTAVPNTKLTVFQSGASGIALADISGGATGAAVLQLSAGKVLSTSSFDLIQNAAGAFINQRDNNPLGIFVNGAERMTISAAGNVGIGISAPSAKLHVSSGYALVNNAYSFAVNNSAASAFAAQFGAAADVAFALGGNNAIITAAGANAILLGTNNVERVRVDADGLKFNGDTAAANALDDYEEGTFTPVYVSGLTGVTYTNTSGKYTKIGRVVQWSARIQATAATAAATTLTIGGFPFTAGGSPETTSSIGYFSIYTTDIVYAFNEANTTNILVFYKKDATPLLGTDLTTATGIIHVSGVYVV